MPLDAQFKLIMQDFVTINRKIGQDRRGNAVYDEANPVICQCRIQNRQTQIRLPNQEFALSTATISLWESINVGTDDRITMPDGSHPPILNRTLDQAPIWGHVEVIYV